MSTDFPVTGIDSYTTRVDGPTNKIYAAHVNDLQDAVVALQTKVGVDASAVITSIDYLLKNASSIDPGHLHTSAGISGQISVAKGGTGLGSIADKALLYASAADTLSALAIGSNGQALVVSGGAPAWAGLTPSEITGTMPVTKGGTGLATIADNAILIATGADTLSALTAGSEGQLLGIVSGAPAWKTVVSTDELLKVSANDTTADYLIGKLAAGSSYLTIAETGDGGDESVTLDIANLIKTDDVGSITVNDASAALEIIQQGAGETLTLESQVTESHALMLKGNDSGVTLSEQQRIFGIESTSDDAVTTLVEMGYHSSGTPAGVGYHGGWLRLKREYSNNGSPSAINDVYISAGTIGNTSDSVGHLRSTHPIGIPAGTFIYNTTSNISVLKKGSSPLPTNSNSHCLIGGASSFDAIVGDGTTLNIGLWAGSGGVIRMGDLDGSGTYMEILESGVLNFTYTMGNSALDPTTDAPADWLEVQIAGTTRYIPAYAAA